MKPNFSKSFKKTVTSTKPLTSQEGFEKIGKILTEFENSIQENLKGVTTFEEQKEYCEIMEESQKLRRTPRGKEYDEGKLKLIQRREIFNKQLGMKLKRSERASDQMRHHQLRSVRIFLNYRDEQYCDINPGDTIVPRK